MNSFKILFHVSSPFTFANLRKAGTDRNRLSKSWSEYSLTSLKIELSRISRTSSKGTSMSTYFLCLIPIWPSQKPFVSSTRNYRMNRKVNNIFYYKNWSWIFYNAYWHHITYLKHELTLVNKSFNFCAFSGLSSITNLICSEE